MTETKAAPGYRAVVAALSVGQLLCWAAMYYGFSSFVLPMQDDLHWDKPTLMGAFTLGLAMWGAASYAVGAAIDRGLARWVLAGGAALGGIGFIAWAAVSEPWMLYAVWLLLGAAMAMTLYEPAFNVMIKRYPDKSRDAITALTLVGGFASTLSFPAVALLLPWLGWRGSLVALGIMLLAVAPLHAWALRGSESATASAGAPAEAGWSLAQALRSGAFWLLTLSFTFYAFAAAALWAHAVPMFAGMGLSEAEALGVLVWIGPAQVAGRIVFAWLGRGWSLQALGLAVLLMMPLALLLLALGRSWPLLLLFAWLFGLANGLSTIVRGGLVPHVFGRAHLGRISGAMSALALSARALAPLAAAWLLLGLGGYRALLIGLAVLGLAAALSFWLAFQVRHTRD